jgi:high-affinity nickel permease
MRLLSIKRSGNPSWREIGSLVATVVGLLGLCIIGVELLVILISLYK